MKFFVPAVGYRIKLTHDWSFNLCHESRNDTLLEIADPSAPCLNGKRDWNSRYLGREYGGTFRKSPATIVAGTVLEVDRVYVRTANKTATSKEDDFDSITFKVIEHPVWNSKKKIRFWAKLDDVNCIEYELPPDHTAGKDAARQKAIQPKKLTPDRIRELVYNSIHAAFAGKKQSFYGSVPSWLSKENIKQFKAIAAEYESRHEPVYRKQHEDAAAKLRAELERDILLKKMHLPMDIADKVKSVDDLLKFNPSYIERLGPYKGSRQFSWDYVIPYTLMQGGSKVVSTKDEQGRRVRTWRGAAAADPNDPNQNWRRGQPDMTHVWIRITTNEDDTQIVDLEAGVDAPKNYESPPL